MKFTVHATAVVSLFKVVEAATADEARDLAEMLGTPTLCHHCCNAGGEDAETWQLSDGIDGSPEIVEVEVES